MTVLKSDIVTDADDKDTQVAAGKVRRDGFSAHLVTAGVVADNVVILLGEIPVDAVVPSIILATDDHGDTGTFNVGLYPGPGSGVTIADDTDAVDEDCIATAIDVNAAAIAPTEIRFEVANISTMNSPAWVLAGLSDRPDYATFYLAITLAQATTAAGDIAVSVRLGQA